MYDTDKIADSHLIVFCSLKAQVLVMTPAILYRGLSHRLIKMELISLLVFDECHYAQVESNHPYAAIMKVNGCGQNFHVTRTYMNLCV